MTKKELMKKLEGVDDNARIVVSIESGHYEGGSKDISDVEPERSVPTPGMVTISLSDDYLWEFDFDDVPEDDDAGDRQ